MSKTRINVLSCDIIIWAELHFVLSQSTRLMDGRAEFSWLERVCILCSAVKNALLTVSLFWDCCRFSSIGLLCYLAKNFHPVVRRPYARLPARTSFCPLPSSPSLRHLKQLQCCVMSDMVRRRRPISSSQLMLKLVFFCELRVPAGCSSVSAVHKRRRESLCAA